MRNAILVLTLAGPAYAGVYFGDGSTHLPRLDQIRKDRGLLRGASNPKEKDPDSKRAQFQAFANRLERARKEWPLTTAERVSLSACYLYLGRAPDAIQLLRTSDPTNHLVLANLATAFFLTGEHAAAARYQSELLRTWPAVTPYWSASEQGRLRTVELAFERLIRHRYQEAQRGITQDLPLDPVIPGFAVETPDGDYEPGSLPTNVRDRLPPDAAITLLQLLLWMPADDRLYWQMGELAAGLGQVEVGSGILEELVFSVNPQYKGIRRHQRALTEAATAYRRLVNPPLENVKQGEPPQRSATPMLLRATGLLIARSAAPPGASGHLLAASALTAPVFVNHFRGEEDPVQPVLPPDEQPARPMPFNLQHIAVSFAFGFLAAALVLFQLQEWRRRANRDPAPDEEVPAEGGDSPSTARTSPPPPPLRSGEGGPAE